MLITSLRLPRFARKGRGRTLDREATPILTSEQIGPKRAKTPEGFMLCQDVAVARVGVMLYGPGEVPIEVGEDGVSRVERGADELFAEATINSYQGKPVVDDHPDVDVNPDNWKKLAIGVVLNPRRGTGDDSDVMLADLLITDAHAIRDVDSGKREVSAGYEADYEQTGKGKGRQTNIIGNHVALVEKGRCGPRCAIGDHQPKELQGMPTKTTRRQTFADKIRKVFGDAAEELAQAMPEGSALDDNESDTHVHIHMGDKPGGDAPAGAAPGATDPTAGAPDDMSAARTTDDPTEARFQALEQGHTEIKDMLQKLMAKIGGTNDEQVQANPETDGPAGSDALSGADVTVKDGLPEEVEAAMGAKTNDSAALETSFRAVMADAEVLIPGFRLPTFDSRSRRKATMDTMCATRRHVLTHLALTTDGAQLINSVAGQAQPDLASMSCINVATMFRAAAGARRAANNGVNTRDAQTIPNVRVVRSNRPVTPADLNKLHATHYNQT